ncbi:hypothetical protein OJF2_64100 [Aquisphaera giovannonii]|uniref:Uncharacterized protein n=1 Tax=Aquisphaera giovannonii TaxID=406548 RepID=A0A5B9WC64_9BACT|nr:hypothetical protein [Aquisphaera giovannonii]QEH37819.1 hypothetical protein OJF2_64100 [Aquisphaera giovannonii]
MADDAPSEDLDERFLELRRRAHELSLRGLYRSNAAVAGELRRLARAEQRIVDYLYGSFELMNYASSRLDPATQSATALELIAALEDEDHARTIQPDLPEAEYSATRAWMTACAYDNLAYATGYQKGLNSEGLHACINEGIEVCRRTGKIECITCFREYATDVYRSADDLDMALHFARLGESHQVVGRHDRRWVGARDQSRLHLLQGRLQAALDDILRSWKLAGTYHSPRIARWKTRLHLEMILLLMGRDDDPDALLGPALTSDDEPEDAEPVELPPPGEFPELEQLSAQVDALRHLVNNRPDEAAAILEKYDRLLDQRGYLSEWFETRLQLIAARRFGGRTGEALARLARPLEERARTARDWLTLRRLARLLDESLPPTPLALLADPAEADGAARPAASETAATAGDSPSPEPPEQPAWTPLQQRITDFYRRASQLAAEGTEAQWQELLAELMAIDPSTVQLPDEAAGLLITAHHFKKQNADLPAVWSWARRLGDRFPEDPAVQSYLAGLGGELRDVPDAPLAQLPSPEDVERLHRRAMDLAPDQPGVFSLAGRYYLEAGNQSEAERCLARGFRLDRTSSFFALQLARIYQQSDRPRDAMAALDLCLREGSEDPAVSWQAATLATALGQWEPVLAYIDHYEAHSPGEPWASYFKAFALVKLNRPDEALDAAVEEGRRSPERPFAWQPLAAAATAAKGDLDGFRAKMAEILAQPLSGVDYLTPRGLVQNLEMLRTAVAVLPADDPIRSRLDALLLSSGLATNEYFDEIRQLGEPVPDVNFYECVVDQPLDESWASSPGCLAGEDDWTAYTIIWGILARDEDEARRIALAWQGRCYPLPARSCEAELTSSGYRDKVGVVWQGMREGRTE